MNIALCPCRFSLPVQKLWRSNFLLLMLFRTVNRMEHIWGRFLSKPSLISVSDLHYFCFCRPFVGWPDGKLCEIVRNSLLKHRGCVPFALTRGNNPDNSNHFLHDSHPRPVIYLAGACTPWTGTASVYPAECTLSLIRASPYITMSSCSLIFHELIDLTPWNFIVHWEKMMFVKCNISLIAKSIFPIWQ